MADENETPNEENVEAAENAEVAAAAGEQAQEVGQEIKQAILSEYNATADPLASNASQSNAVKAKQTAASNNDSSKDSSPPRDRKPLWGF